MRNPKLALALLAALTLAASALRLRGIGFGLPLAVEDDCKIPHQVEVLRAGGTDWRSDKEFRWYPLFVAHVAKLWPAAEPAAQDATLQAHLDAAAEPQLQVRRTVALLAILTVPLTYVLACFFLARRWALVAAAFITFSLLHQSFSQQSRPHAVAGTLFLATVVAALRMRRKGDALNYATAGGMAALALGCLQSAVALLPALALAHFARRTHKRRWLDWRLLLIVVTIGFAVPVFYPFLLFGDEAAVTPAISFADWTLKLGGHEIFLREFAGRGLKPLLWSLWSYEPTLLVLLGVAAVAWFALRRERAGRARDYSRRRDVWVVLAFVAPYVLMLALYSRTYERFVLPLLPFAALAAAYAVRELAHTAGRWSAALRAPAGQASVAALALAAPACATWCLASIRAEPSTMILAAGELQRIATPDDDVALWPRVDLPLCRQPAGFANWMPGGIERQFTWVWSRYQAALPAGHGPEPLWKLRWWRPNLALMRDDPLAYIRRQGGKFIVLEVFADERAHPAGTTVQVALRSIAQRRARISPDADPAYSEHPLGYQEESSVPAPHFFARVLQAQRSGPVLEIYELPAD